MPEPEQAKPEPKSVKLPPIDKLFEAFEAADLIGKHQRADTIYVTMASYLAGKEISGYPLTLFFLKSLQEETEMPDFDPVATNFILTHFEEFLNATVPTAPEVASDAREAMTEIVRVTRQQGIARTMIKDFSRN